MTKTFCSACVILLMFCAGFFVGRGSLSTSIPETRVDTLVVYDTIRDVVPQYVTRYVVRTDSVPYTLVQNDTVRETLYVPITIERKEYKTSDYYAIVEGYTPSLYYIETYNKTTIIDRVERYKTKSRWGFGVQAGVGYQFNEKITPYIGIGIQYNILTW